MFTARRKPKRIARDEPEDTTNKTEEDDEQDQAGPVVRRPNAAPRTKSKLRTSFAPDEAEDSSDMPGTVVTKPKHRLATTATSQGQSNGTSQSLLPRFNIENRMPEDNLSRPSYSKSALEDLRNSTPSTPRDLATYSDPASSGAEDGIRDLDLSSKFGPTAASSSKAKTAIPSAAEIAEKKSRRARLALEQKAEEEDYIALDGGSGTGGSSRNNGGSRTTNTMMDDEILYDSDGEFKPRRLQVGSYLNRDNQLSIYGNDSSEKDTRLLRDDEDLMEGFEDFTEDVQSSRITMSKPQILQAQRQDRETIRNLINRAEGGGGGINSASASGSDNSNSDFDSDDSERERDQAYMTAQTAHGMDGLTSAKAAQRQHQQPGANRPRPPKETVPVPKPNVALGKLKDRIAAVEIQRVRLERRLAEVRRERNEIKASQEHIQRSLTEAGEELRMVMEKKKNQEEKGEGEGVNGNRFGNEVAADATSTTTPAMNDYFSNGVTPNTNTMTTGRGLDSMGTDSK